MASWITARAALFAPRLTKNSPCSSRAARAVIQDAIASWSSIGAGGKSSQLAEKHEWLLLALQLKGQGFFKGPTMNLAMVDRRLEALDGSAMIDHCQIHGWPLEEALALELQGEFLVRRGAKRAARAVSLCGRSRLEQPFMFFSKLRRFATSANRAP
jgi:hypothetical protein